MTLSRNSCNYFIRYLKMAVYYLKMAVYNDEGIKRAHA